MKPFRHIIIFFNPASTRAGLVGRRIERLRELYPDAVEVIHTSPDGRLANQAMLRQLSGKLGPESLLGIAAGDGTVNMVLETLMLDPDLPEAARHTPILPLWGGNANDLAHMLNGPAPRGSFERLMKAAKVVAVRPLLCTLEHEGDIREVRLAAGYVSFGASAVAAQELNNPQHRDHPVRSMGAGGQLVSEVSAVVRAMRKAPRFAVQDGSEQRLVYERIFLNGPRFAKTQSVPLKLTDEYFYHVTVERKKTSALIFHALELVGREPTSETAKTRAAFTALEPTWAQFDGEPMAVAANTRVEVTLAERPFYALSTML